MVDLKEVKNALDNRTEYENVKIEEDRFVYAKINDNTGMKFELPVGFNEDKENDNVAYLVWEENDHVEQNEVKNDLDAIVNKANEVYNYLS